MKCSFAVPLTTLVIGLGSGRSLPVLAAAEITQVLPLSGMGEAGESPVYWEFKLDNGRGSSAGNGKWNRTAVPSNWEQQGYGTYYYGTQGRGKPDDDPVIPKETGTYRREFQIPARWDGHEIHIVFEAAMTDTSVTINGQSAGPVHQGGFYRFSYDITKFVKPGRNEIQVDVSKESSNKSVNHAERRGDYWTFGGIYRPVWLEARPRDHIVWTAIDARADGTFYARAHLNRPAPQGARLRAQVLDASGNKLGAALTAQAIHGDTAIFQGAYASPALWTAETPSLYSAKFTLESEAGVLHERRERFGFRTLEVRPRDGVYLNGRKIVLKGINRHSFNPKTGRTLSREQNYADARLIKSANMNAVRMSHYPPDPAFLEAADELGLYVVNELAGWQGFYDTPTGARLIGQIVRRDVNHPSVLFWANGNEGGWNRENDGEFDRWDPQRRPVLHPWAIHSGINTDHYENYDSTVRLSAGPDIFMPTEFLHGLYDGGIGAGFRDYWNVMGRSPTVAGGFFWVFADEGIERTDQKGRIDNVGNAAPDGIVGANHEKEGSFFAVKEIWSPVELRDLVLDDGRLRTYVENRYDFNDLERCSLTWRVLRLPAVDRRATSAQVLAEGRQKLPALAARHGRQWEMPVGVKTLAGDEILEVAVHDPQQQELWKWVVRGASRALPTTRPTPRISTRGQTISAGPHALTFDAATGMLERLTTRGRAIPLQGPHLVAWQRAPKLRSFTEAAGKSSLRKLELAPSGNEAILARAEYDGALREVTWKIRGDDLVVNYRIAFEGEADILGVSFDYPETSVLGKRWVGAGPYRIWKNRQAGTAFGLHEANYSRSTPGVSYEYPEFEGFFGEWNWLELRAREAKVVIHNASAVPYFGLYRPTPGEKPILELPDLGLSFLHAVPAIGTKFALPDVLGPQSQPTQFTAPIEGELTIIIGT
ncbi:MAG TPA: glycoside hydrolase family 2 TIM barrel-domain containing protein [Steroidobacteraceae bacterium]|nr:glycoside hydrolase family 2 TIM barrel-domain containing protein [Steroidobacteraceae bacterium]